MNNDIVKVDPNALKTWLRREVTITLPVWMLASGAFGVLVLLLIALD